MNRDDIYTYILVVAAIILAIFIFIGSCFGIGYLWRQYNVWSSGMAGKAQLAQAEWNRQIAVREALAKKDAAVALAEAEVERAQGVAKANKIIGDSLKNNEEYLRYLFVNNLENTKNQIIYVPTETNLPILEASRNK